MKPTKNQVFCRDCGRTKMLFESEKKALNFIKFNGEEIKEKNGKSPVRAYYCPICCGWHVTSREDMAEGYHSRNERWVNSYIDRKRAEGKLLCDNLENKKKARKPVPEQSTVKHQEEMRRIYEDAGSILTTLDRNLEEGKTDHMEEALTLISNTMESYMEEDFMSSKRNSIVKKVNQLKEKLDLNTALYGPAVDMPAIVTKVREKIHSADVLFDYGLYPEAQSYISESIATLEYYAQSILMAEDRRCLMSKAKCLQKLLYTRSDTSAA